MSNVQSRANRAAGVVLGLLLCAGGAARAAAAATGGPGREGAAVRHPNLLLNKEEIEQVKAKVREHAWAARLLDRVKEKVEKEGSGAYLESAIAYVLTGDKKYAD